VDVEVTGPDTAVASVRVRNTGERAGKHVVQVYVSTEAGPVRRPLRELRGFTKVSVAPGEIVDVRIELPRRAFAYWDIDRADWAVTPGDYAVELAENATEVVSSRPIELDGDSQAGALTLDTPVGAWLDHPDVGADTSQALGFAGVDVPAEQLAMVRSMTMRQFVRISGLPISTDDLDALIARTR